MAELVPIEGNGVEVRIEEATVGFLQHGDRELLDAAIEDSIHEDGEATCRAMIRGGWDRGGDDVGFFGVTLYLPTGPIEEELSLSPEGSDHL